ISDCSPSSAKRKSACSSKAEVLPPVGLAAMLPVSSKRCSHLTAELALISKRSAASRRDAPAITASRTRSRRSIEQGFGIDPSIESMPQDSLNPPKLGILDSTQQRYALAYDIRTNTVEGAASSFGWARRDCCRLDCCWLDCCWLGSGATGLGAVLGRRRPLLWRRLWWLSE